MKEKNPSTTYHAEGERLLRSRLRRAERLGILETIKRFLATKLALRATTKANYTYIITSLYQAYPKPLREISAQEFSEWIQHARGQGRTTRLSQGKEVLRWAHGGTLPPEIERLRLPKTSTVGVW